MKVLVFEIGDTFPPFRALKSGGFGLRTPTRCYGLGKTTKALSVQGLLLRLLPSCKVIDYAVELSAHLSGVLILVFILLLINLLVLLVGELLTLIVLEVISRVLGVTFLLLVLILLIEGHLIDLII